MKKITIFLFIFLISACAKVPLTGRKQFTVIPSSEINSLGVTSYNQIVDSVGVSHNQQYIQSVTRVGKRLTAAVENYLKQHHMEDRIKNFHWQYTVLHSNEMNAFCLPGGKIAFYEGILPVCKDDNGIAVVMSHEIGHAIAQHGNERMSQELAVNLGGMALSEALQSQTQQTYRLAMSAFGLGSQVGVLLPYSRLHESEADELGLYFMAMAGYDPRLAPDFWQRMIDQGGSRPPQFLSTHPDPKNRIKHLNEIMDKAMKYYNNSSQ